MNCDLLFTDQAPKYIRGHTIALAFVSAAWVFVALNLYVVGNSSHRDDLLTVLSAYCIWENKARADGRRNGNVDRYQELWDLGKTRAPIGDRSPAFRFTL